MAAVRLLLFDCEGVQIQFQFPIRSALELPANFIGSQIGPLAINVGQPV